MEKETRDAVAWRGQRPREVWTAKKAVAHDVD